MSLIETRHIIDCNASPYVPSGMRVLKHLKHGQLEWDPAKVRLYRDGAQERYEAIKGRKLRKKLRTVGGGRLLNANVLDYLLANPYLIPESWKVYWVFFWGTVYSCVDTGRRSVRYLAWRSGSGWYWNSLWLDSDFNQYDPAALFIND